MIPVPDTRVFTLEGSSTSDGNSEELTKTDNEDHTIEKVQVVEGSGTDLTGSTATLQVRGDSVTDQVVPISVLQYPYEDLPEMGLEWAQGQQFKFSWTNASGSSATVRVLLWVG